MMLRVHKGSPVAMAAGAAMRSAVFSAGIRPRLLHKQSFVSINSKRFRLPSSMPLWKNLCTISVANMANGFSFSHASNVGPQYATCRMQNSSVRCVAGSTADADVAYDVDVIREETLPDSEELQKLIERMKVDGCQALKVATDGLEDVDNSESVELAVLVCSDEHIQSLNKDWLGKDAPTDVLSFPQQQPPGLNPTLLLGDIVISLDTTARQATQRGHSLQDEARILLVHGLLHLLGYDHEESLEAEVEMGEEEQRILSVLGWKGKGLIESASGGESESASENEQGFTETSEKAAALGTTTVLSGRVKRPPFRYLFCDMDGTLLNSESKITKSTAGALRAAKDRGVTVVIATGKARPAAMDALGSMGLTGDTGVVTLSSPGVFLQGLRVYGNCGSIVHNALLPKDVCEDAFEFAQKHSLALIGFSGDRCVTLLDHPLVEKLHTRFYEPRATVLSSFEELIEEAPIQKLLFYDTVDGIKKFIRPYWSDAVERRATVTQAVEDMLEILPHGASKGVGVRILLDHLGVAVEEIMAIGDGENDLEMIEMAGWGVAMANGSNKTLAVANAVVKSNDEDGVAEAIERFILS